jgi:hypothetical protein
VVVGGEPFLSLTLFLSLLLSVAFASQFGSRATSATAG